MNIELLATIITQLPLIKKNMEAVKPTATEELRKVAGLSKKEIELGLPFCKVAQDRIEIECLNAVLVLKYGITAEEAITISGTLLPLIDQQ